ncbi:hypothetical protein GUY44_12215 [Pimelobacter simplex]|uniref:hypothetical protein n=1 Tax=Nocardioides simplex TaxID=2045 RepID=UPI000535CC3C|nr:hypothetical protein [Pimelobacter simplex]MCG8151248.1 hypothetical protein [Pimelobacter simplex]GEB12199.1 hypothetical protein NSI01_05140 [Pimelobacter simplex]SFN16771.1 hypothetical protein SAMN05421671_5499 [Pimelobacter simplex]
MAKPRTITPRRHLEHPDLFGRPGNHTWLQPTTPEEYAGLRAAELQHHFGLALVSLLTELSEPKSWLEEQAGLATGRISKVLRGHAQLTFRDVAAIEGIVGPILARLEVSRQPIEDQGLRERFAREP